MSGALADLVVVDRSDTVAGQYCARLFADFGASVHLAEPAGGSPIRAMAPFDGAGNSLTFLHLNLGKRSGPPPRAPDVVVCAPGEDPATLKTPEDVAPQILALLSPASQRQGEVVDYQP